MKYIPGASTFIRSVTGNWRLHANYGEIAAKKLYDWMLYDQPYQELKDWVNQRKSEGFDENRFQTPRDIRWHLLLPFYREAARLEIALGV